VTVQASNLVSNESTTMEFIVEKPVTGLSINTSTEYVLLGDDVFFQAFITGGTNVQFDWSFGDLQSAADAGTLLMMLILISLWVYGVFILTRNLPWFVHLPYCLKCTKFGQLNFGKVIKIVDTGCHI